MAWDLWCFEDLEEKDRSIDQSINQLINDRGVCRTAPATPGLLKVYALLSEPGLLATVYRARTDTPSLNCFLVSSTDPSQCPQLWKMRKRLKHSENRKTLPREHLIHCRGVKLFLLKDSFKDLS